MSAARWSFVIEKNVDFDKTLTYLVGPAGALVPFNFTGYSAQMDIRAEQDPLSTLYLTLSTANGRIVLGGVAGTCQLLLDALVTAGLSWGGRAYYDIKLDNGTIQFRLAEGRVGLSPPVTP